MNKNVKAVLIIGGVVVAILAVAFVADAAGLTTNYGYMPYRQQMMQGAYGWQGGMMGGNYGGMMGGGYGGMMGGWSGRMMDFDDMPYRNLVREDSQSPWENCPYHNQAQ